MPADEILAPALAANSSDLARPPARQVVLRVMLNQMIFNAGNALTTGGFFYYFLSGFKPGGLWMAGFMVVPEICQSLSMLAQLFAGTLRWRKPICIGALLASRLCALGIPLVLLLKTGPETTWIALTYLLVCTIAFSLLQGLSYVHYISWLSALQPASRWGRLFSWRQTAGLLISVLIPLGTLLLRRRLLAALPPEAAQWSYALLFVLGGCTVMLSVLPLLSLPAMPLISAGPRLRLSFSGWSNLWNQAFGRLLACRWTAAFFQGLTQSLLFKFAQGPLHISLETWTMLTSLMLALQIPVSRWAGQVSDCNHDRRGMFWGLLVASCAMPCWMLATPQSWQFLIPAYACWSAFAMVNICGLNLCLKQVPAERQIEALALYDQVSGLIAGLAGLLGGYWLDLRLQGLSGAGFDAAPAYQLILFVSWLGRVLAPCWLLTWPLEPERALKKCSL